MLLIATGRIPMRRREFLTLIAGASILRSAGAGAQQSNKVYRIAFLHPSHPVAEMTQNSSLPYCCSCGFRPQISLPNGTTVADYHREDGPSCPLGALFYSRQEPPVGDRVELRFNVLGIEARSCHAGHRNGACRWVARRAVLAPLPAPVRDARRSSGSLAMLEAMRPRRA